MTAPLSTPRSVVVTGMGLVSALGPDVPSAFSRLREPRNCVLASDDLATYKGLQTRLCAPIPDFDPAARYSRKILRSMGRVAVLALAATDEALAQAGLLDDPGTLSSGRLGVAYGSSSGSIDAIADFYTILRDREVRNVTSSTYLKMMPQTTAVNLSVHYRTTGRLLPTGTACTSGSLAIGLAYEAIRDGLQDVMIAGGAEEFSVTQITVFDTLYATSRRNDAPAATPRAFDADRDGLVIGEGAGTLLLEAEDHARARGAPILARVVGFGTNTDGTHVTQPNAATMARCLQLALDDAAIPASELAYVNAHGTATDLGDIAEGTASAAVYPASVPFSTLKNYIGHTLGACGAIEAALTIEMLRHAWAAPNLNLEHPDPRCGEHNYVLGDGLPLAAPRYAASNNFAFGGVNTSLVLALP